ncbi:MAG: hypothetical protein K1Y02_15560 [Candidatus Hydrogenedentes bacterium]|nr:hypothetical protein [Candidatus Hydrogenedentota bacterium]
MDDPGSTIDRRLIVGALVISLVATTVIVAVAWLPDLLHSLSAKARVALPVETPVTSATPDPTPAPVAAAQAPSPAINAANISTTPPAPAPQREAESRNPDAPETIIRVTGDAVISKAKRFGINIGARNIYGAEQMIKNIIPNPGFESGIYGTVFHSLDGSTGRRIVQDFWETAWNLDEYGIGQPAGFWKGGEYEGVYGAVKGRSGAISDFTLENNRNVFHLDADGPAPNKWDVFFARTHLPGIAAGNRMSEDAVDTTTTRPGSPGKQSLRLGGANPDFTLYLDSEWRDGDRTAGKLLVVKGNWKLSLWAKGRSSADKIRVQFYREGEAYFVDETIPLTEEWQSFERVFVVPEGGDRLDGYTVEGNHPILLFRIVAEEGSGVWLDDLDVECADNANPTVFTDAFVNALKDLRPGVLRNWSTQLGDTLDNQLAEPWARKTIGFRPGSRVAENYCFSLHEFLQLCNEVGAEPWYVVPPTFSPNDLKGIVEYLAGPADGAHPYADRRAALGQTEPWTSVFSTVHLEYGNEMWGAASGSDPFFGASALGGERLGSIAGDRFGILKTSPLYTPEKLDLIIGGQVGYPERQGEIAANSTNHATVALAPYFGELERGDTPETMYYPLFARPAADAITGNVRKSWDFIARRSKSTRLAVYEINFHTTGGDAPIEVRNAFVTGASGAIALPLYMLSYLRDFGAREQCGFTSLQYAFRMENKEYVRIWGMLRDIAATGRKRPTWLGVELANKAVQGDLVSTAQSGRNPLRVQPTGKSIDKETPFNLVQSFAFHDGASWSIVLFNLDIASEQPVRVEFPEGAPTKGTIYQIAPSRLDDTNEQKTTVEIATTPRDDLSSPIALTLPKHSITAVVLKP